MTEALYSFPPDTGDARFTLWTGLLIAVGCLAGAWFILRSPGRGETRNYRMLGAMLLFFGFLIGAVMTIFSWWSTQKLSVVRIYADRIETPYGSASFDRIKNAAIETERERSFVNPNLTTDSFRLLIIEETDGKTHVLSEENYDLPAIMQRLREEIKKEEERRE
jgi:hypothetical protein